MGKAIKGEMGKLNKMRTWAVWSLLVGWGWVGGRSFTLEVRQEVQGMPPALASPDSTAVLTRQ